jgi:hypothetical protein
MAFALRSLRLAKTAEAPWTPSAESFDFHTGTPSPTSGPCTRTRPEAQLRCFGPRADEHSMGNKHTPTRSFRRSLVPKNLEFFGVPVLAPPNQRDRRECFSDRWCSATTGSEGSPASATINRGRSASETTGASLQAHLLGSAARDAVRAYAITLRLYYGRKSALGRASSAGPHQEFAFAAHALCL